MLTLMKKAKPIRIRPTTIRLGIALRPVDQALVAKLQKAHSDALGPPGPTEIIRLALVALDARNAA